MLLPLAFLLLQSPAPSSHVVVVTGLGGEPAYRQELAAWAGSLTRSAREAGVPAANIQWLAGDGAAEPGRLRATREQVLATLQELARRTRPGDPVLLFLAGHGSHQGEESRINLPGPDLTAADLEVALAPLADRRVAIVNAASASGDFVTVLSRQGRIVITATKSPFERNVTRFAGHFVAAFAGLAADVDKDGRVSLLEAFLYGKRETARVYESDNRLLTEHAMLDDNGDRQGSAAPGAEGADGALARAFFVGTAATRAFPSDTASVRIAGEARALETRIAELRSRKSTMKEDEYQSQLESLLVELALRNEALRARRSP